MLPPEPATAHGHDEGVAGVTQEPQHDRGAEHLVHEEEVPPVVDEVAEPLLGTDELGDDDDEERERHTEADPREDLRQRRRQHDAEEEPRAPRAQARGGAEQQRVHLPDRVDRREEHREERRVGDERDLRSHADSDPDDEERQHRQRRDRPQDLDDRLEQVADHGEVPGGEPEGERQEGARREADDDALERGGDVAPELARRRELRHLPQDEPRAGEEDRIEELPEHDESRREAPHEQEGDDGASPEYQGATSRERRPGEPPLHQVHHRAHEHDLLAPCSRSDRLDGGAAVWWTYLTRRASGQDGAEALYSAAMGDLLLRRGMIEIVGQPRTETP